MNSVSLPSILACQTISVRHLIFFILSLYVLLVHPSFLPYLSTASSLWLSNCSFLHSLLFRYFQLLLLVVSFVLSQMISVTFLPFSRTLISLALHHMWSHTYITSNPLQKQSHTQTHTHTHTQKNKKKKRHITPTHVPIQPSHTYTHIKRGVCDRYRETDLISE